MKFLSFRVKKINIPYFFKRINEEKGAALIIFAFLIPIFFILMGIVIDIGSAMALKEELNKACLIAAEESTKNINIDKAQAEGVNVLKEDFSNSIELYFYENINKSKSFELISLSYDIPSGLDDPRFVEVFCEAELNTYFLKIFGVEKINIHSSGIGRLRKIK